MVFDASTEPPVCIDSTHLLRENNTGASLDYDVSQARDITLEDVIRDSMMQSSFLQYLSTFDKKGFARFLFLVSVDEFKNLLGHEHSVSSPRETHSVPKMEGPDSGGSSNVRNALNRRITYAKKIISKFMSKDSFLDIASENLQVFNKSVWAFGNFLRRDLMMCSGICFKADLFQEIETVVKQALEPSLYNFKQTTEFEDLVQSFNIESLYFPDPSLSKPAAFKSSMPRTIKENVIKTIESCTSEILSDSSIFHSQLATLRSAKNRIRGKKNVTQSSLASSLRDTYLTLERVLNNRRLCSVFWVYLYKERIHQPLSLWMDFRHQFMPILQQLRHTLVDVETVDMESDELDSAELIEQLIMLSSRIIKKYMIVGASAQIYFIGDTEQAAMQDFVDHTDQVVQQHAFTVANLDTMISQVLFLSEKLEYDLNVNHFVRFMGSTSFKSIVSSYQGRLLSSSGLVEIEGRAGSSKCSSMVQMSQDTLSDSDTSSETSMTTLQELFHCMNVASHQPQRIRTKKFALEELVENRGLPKDLTTPISSLISFHFDRKDQKLKNQILFTLSNTEAGVSYHHTIPEHVEVFFCPEGAGVIRAKTRPSPRLFHMTIGNLEKSFHAACLTRYVAVTERMPLGPLEQLLHDEDGMEVYIPVGLCIISRFPLLNTMKYRLDQLHCSSQSDERYLNSIDWTPSPIQLTALLAPYKLPIHLEVTPSSNTHQLLEDFSMGVLFQSLSIPNIIALISCVMLERQIVLVSSYYSVLTSVGETLKSLLSPLIWSHIFAPILPKPMLECLQCPTPYLFGIHTSYQAEMMEILHNEGTGDNIIVVDLDADRLTGKAVQLIPESIFTSLQCNIEKLARSAKDCVSSDLTSPPGSQSLEKSQWTGTKDLEANFRCIRACFGSLLDEMMTEMEEYRFVLSDDFDFVVVFDNQRYLQKLLPASRDFYLQFLETQVFSHAIATVK
uniref:Uncharacterized protein AlNc14C123G6726 n=1 Tax=Albugo laibachii Nc14 TaxID=890382 RepID=F0WJK1_9STRA|nr:conserved hypothetical protein [Albugo laibachii Nc14]|eukprot:CCA21450.1 conserved hypothetical protein [Albugo laibachii Nc14]